MEIIISENGNKEKWMDKANYIVKVMIQSNKENGPTIYFKIIDFYF
jgi:hypothetical protein